MNDPATITTILTSIMGLIAFLSSTLVRSVLAKHEERANTHAATQKEHEQRIRALETHKDVEAAHAQHHNKALEKLSRNVEQIMAKLGIHSGSVPHIGVDGDS